MKDKRWFIGYLKGLYRDENAPELKKLITELKKRRLEFYTHPEGHKLLIIPQRQKWHRNKTVVENGMPDYFDMSIEDRRYEVLLMWPEVLGSHPEATFSVYTTPEGEKLDGYVFSFGMVADFLEKVYEKEQPNSEPIGEWVENQCKDEK